jgi:manganese/iron transport system ATP-binding protein
VTRPTPGDPVLDVRGLSVDLGGRPALHDVDLALGAGELTGLIGPNGAGKTTLLRAVLGLIPARAGTVTVDGRRAEQARGSVGYVPQRHEFAWDFPTTVTGAVMTGLTHRIGLLRRPRPEDHAAVADALELARLTDLRDRPLGELSGGQRQRVLVARALAVRPDLLLLDEPFTGLDVPTQELLTALLSTLRDDGRTVLLTTHDLPAAAALCGRIVLLNRTVVADAPPEELRDPAVWLRAFGVTSSDGLLHALGVAA